MELKRNSNAVYLLNYHLILVVKYRKKVFTNNEIVERTKELMRKISAENDDAVADGIEVHFIPSLDTPIEPEDAEKMYARLAGSSELGEPDSVSSSSLQSDASNASPEVK